MGLDLFDLFQKTAKLGDGYDDRNVKDKPFSFTEKETFSGVNILTASEVCMETNKNSLFTLRHLLNKINIVIDPPKGPFQGQCEQILKQIFLNEHLLLLKIETLRTVTRVSRTKQSSDCVINKHL